MAAEKYKVNKRILGPVLIDKLQRQIEVEVDDVVYVTCIHPNKM